MSQKTIVFVDLCLFGYQWLALLNRPLGSLESRHLCVRPARDGRPHEVEMLDQLDLLCGRLGQANDRAGIVNLGYGGQLERHARSLLPLLEGEPEVFLHEREQASFPIGIGGALARRGRASVRRYTTEPVTPGQEPSEAQRAWSDLVARLGLELPPSTMANLVHDFIGKLATLEITLREMESSDGCKLMAELLRAFRGHRQEEDARQEVDARGEVDAYLRGLRNSHADLRLRLAERVKSSRLDADQAARVKAWFGVTAELMGKIRRAAEGDRSACKGIDRDFTALRASLNDISGLRL